MPTTPSRPTRLPDRDDVVAGWARSALQPGQGAGKVAVEAVWRRVSGDKWKRGQKRGENEGERRGAGFVLSAGGRGEFGLGRGAPGSFCRGLAHASGCQKEWVSGSFCRGGAPGSFCRNGVGGRSGWEGAGLRFVLSGRIGWGRDDPRHPRFGFIWSCRGLAHALGCQEERGAGFVLSGRFEGRSGWEGAGGGGESLLNIIRRKVGERSGNVGKNGAGGLCDAPGGQDPRLASGPVPGQDESPAQPLALVHPAPETGPT